MMKYFVAAAVLAAATVSHAATTQSCSDMIKRSGLKADELLSEEKLKLMREKFAANKAAGEASFALVYICGVGVKKDVEEGIRMLEKSHADGNTTAASVLVGLYLGMMDVPPDPAKLLHWTKVGAEDGEPGLQLGLAGILDQGILAKKDDAAAERLYLKAAAQGLVQAYGHLGNFYFSKQKYAEALRWFDLGASVGDTNAQAGLGSLYAGGFGVTRDHAKALQWWKCAASKNSAMAQFGLGTLYANGWGVGRDDAQALAWFQLAANQGFAGAQAAMANAYEWGIGVPLDANAAQGWRKKADQSARAAAQNIRRMYPDCCDGASDQAMAEASKSYRLDADGGAADAQLVFARFLLSNKKTQDAIVWYERAAAQGHAQAMAELGGVYLSGYGLPAKPELGLKLTRLAAEQGNTLARMRLAETYQKGIFVRQSLIAAYALYFNAAPQGQDAGQSLNTYHSPFDDVMSAADITRAKQLVRAMATPGSFLTALDDASAH